MWIIQTEPAIRNKVESAKMASQNKPKKIGAMLNWTNKQAIVFIGKRKY